MNLKKEDDASDDHEHGEDAHPAHGATKSDVETGFQGLAGFVFNYCTLKGSGVSGVAALSNDHAVWIDLKRGVRI